MNAAAFRQLVDYNYWAHRRVWNCIMGLTDEQFARELNYSVGSIRNQVVHTLAYERVYLLRLQGNATPNLLAYDDFPNREAVRFRWDEIEAAFREYANGLEDSQLEEIVHYRSIGGDPYSDLRRELLLHVAIHGADHRAQTLAMLHSLGVETVGQDFIYYLRDPQQKLT